MGKILRRGLLDEMHQIDRFPSVQDFASSARLVPCRKQAGGKRWGTSGQHIGHAHLQGAFSAAATLCLRHHPQGQQRLRRFGETA
jgi:transposase